MQHDGATRAEAGTTSIARKLADEAGFVVQSARPGFWLTAIWFYLMPVAQQPVLGTAAFWLGMFFVAFPFGLLIYGWNDIADAEGDRFNRRKGNFLFGARGTPEELRRLPWIIAAVHLVCGALMVRLHGWRPIGWYVVLIAATALYNWPRIGFKRWPVLDLLNQAGYLLVFDFSSMINGVPPARWDTMAFGVTFALHSHLLGQILDLEPDRQAGRKTTAIVLGPVRSKLLNSSLLVAEALFVQMSFQQTFVALGLAAGALWFVADALVLFGARAYPDWLSRLFLVSWNVVAAVTAPWVYLGAPFSC